MVIDRGSRCWWSTARRKAKGLGALVVAAWLGAFALPAHAQEDFRWIDGWTASPQPLWSAEFPVPMGVPAHLWQQTIRQIVLVGVGGNRVRVVLTNEFGETPLVVGAAHVALAGDGGSIKPGTDRPLTFSGEKTIAIPPGAPAISDPVELEVPAFTQLAISLFLPEVTPTTTMHWDGHQTAFITAGDTTADVMVKPDSKILPRLFLNSVMIQAPADTRAIVTFGDSITDGDGSTVDANRRWPDLLAQRIADEGGPPIVILNEGISGAKVLSDRMGINALARFDQDVLSHPYVDTVILMMGINDIGWPGSALAPKDEVPAAQDIINGYEQLIDRAHAHGIRIIGATLTPFEDAFVGTPFEGYYSTRKEEVRAAVNSWIRDSGAFDGLIDFDAAVRDPKRPTRILETFDKGDHLHPQDAGYEAMANAVDLNMLLGR